MSLQYTVSASLFLLLISTVSCTNSQDAQVVSDSAIEPAVLETPASSPQASSTVATSSEIDTPSDETLTAQSQTPWMSSGFYTLTVAPENSNREPHASYVYIDSPSSNAIDVYKTSDRDPFGSFAYCGGLGCALERGELTASLQLRPTGSNEYIVDSATGTASFLQGTRCMTQMWHDLALICSSSSGPISELPSTIEFNPGT